MKILKFQKIIINIVSLMVKEVLVNSRVGNPCSSSWSYLIGFTTCVLHPLIWLIMRLFFHFFYKWIPIFSLLKKLLLKFYANEFPYIFFVQELFFTNSLQIGTHVFFFQDLYETISWQIQLMNKSNLFKAP